jgi:hypothetical protein
MYRSRKGILRRLQVHKQLELDGHTLMGEGEGEGGADGGRSDKAQGKVCSGVP